jgi:hypothetical protein
MGAIIGVSGSGAEVHFGFCRESFS